MTVEYDLILGENDERVLFFIQGREVTIPRSKILSFDYEGRLTVTKEVGQEFGLSEATSA